MAAIDLPIGAGSQPRNDHQGGASERLAVVRRGRPDPGRRFADPHDDPVEHLRDTSFGQGYAGWSHGDGAGFLFSACHYSADHLKSGDR
jgi:hypothetical protein